MNYSSVIHLSLLFLAGILGPWCSIAHSIERPMGPIVYASAQGGYEVFWFYPGFHQSNLGVLDINPDDSRVPGTQDREYSIFSNFEIRPPTMIKKAGLVIMNEDPFPEYDGDQFTPLALMLQRTMSSDFSQIIWSDTVALDSQSILGGQVIMAEAGAPVYDLYSVWLSLQWLAGFPAAPAAGISREHYTFLQYVCSPYEPNFVVQGTLEQYLVGMQVLEWTDHPGNIYEEEQGSDVRFSVIFNSENEISSPIILLDSIDADSLYGHIQISEKGYLRVAALEKGEESHSDSVYIDSGKRPQIVLQPAFFRGKLRRNEENQYSFKIRNDNFTSGICHLKYDRNLVQISPDSVALSPGEEATVLFELVELPAIDSVLTTDLIIESENYQAMIYHIVLTEDKPLNIRDDNDRHFPTAYKIGEPYPNPFNSQVNMAVDGPGRKAVQYAVYDILGREIYSGNLTLEKGQNIVWKGTDQKGRTAATGLYFFRIQIDNCEFIRKAVFLK